MTTLVSYHGSLLDYHGTYVLDNESVNAYAPPECQRFTLLPSADHGTTETLRGARPGSVTFLRSPELSPTGDGLAVLCGAVLAFLAEAADALHFERSLDHYHYGSREGARWLGPEYVTGATFSLCFPLSLRGTFGERTAEVRCDSWDTDTDRERADDVLIALWSHLQGLAAAA